MAKRIAFFNHKGGVSKTTSVYNIGWLLSGKNKVLLVDADPQCNLSSLMLGDDFEKYYLDDHTKAENIKDGVSVAFEAKPYPIQAVDCIAHKRASNLHLLAGHQNLSEYDAALTFAQTSNNALATLQNLPGAFSELIRLTEEKYAIDYTLIDLNPSLSAINQNLFLCTNGFIVPTNPDPFSIMAIDTLTNILPRWVEWKSRSVAMFADSAYPLFDGSPKFLGSLIQRFNIRNGKAARPYRNNIEEIKVKMADTFYSAISLAGMGLDSNYPGEFVADGYCLAEIPDFQGLLPKSQQAGVPVFALKDQEIHERGSVLTGMKKKRDALRENFDTLLKKIENLLPYV